MADTEMEKNTSARSQILDADYILREEAPNTPRVLPEGDVPEKSPLWLIFLLVLLTVLMLAGSLLSRNVRDVRARREAAENEAFSLLSSGEASVPGELRAADGELPEAERLGIRVRTVSPRAAAYYGLTPGAEVLSLTEDGPGAAAGLQPGDVITALGQERVRSARELLSAQEAAPEGEAELTVFRAGETITLTAALP